MNTALVLDEALRLPKRTRALLAQALVDSLDEQREVERAWKAELQARLARLDAGEPTRDALAVVDAEARRLRAQRRRRSQ